MQQKKIIFGQIKAGFQQILAEAREFKLKKRLCLVLSKFQTE